MKPSSAQLLKSLSILLIFSTLLACASRPTPQPDEIVEAPAPTLSKADAMVARLGMQRDLSHLGFEQKQFNPCTHDFTTSGQCQSQFLTVVHFQLLCRDTTGTVQEVPKELTPLSSDHVQWKLGGQSGITQTDTEGLGRLVMISHQTTRGQRLMLRIGKQFLGFTASEITKVILPSNFCQSSEQIAAQNR